MVMLRPVVKLPAFCFHTALTNKRRRSRKFPRLRSRGAMFHQPELHRTDHNEPPQTPDRVCQIGSYCMRAFTQLHDSKNKNDVIREYNGFDENTNIVDKVIDVCERDIQRFGNQYQCAPARLFFLGPMENCDGRVNIFDLKHNTVSVIH